MTVQATEARRSFFWYSQVDPAADDEAYAKLEYGGGAQVQRRREEEEETKRQWEEKERDPQPYL